MHRIAIRQGRRVRHARARTHQRRREFGFLLRMRRTKALRIGIEGQPCTHDGLALGRVLQVAQPHAQTEAVEQLRAQRALFRVHGAHEHEARGMPVRDAVALHHVDAAGRRVEQRVDERVGQQVDLVDVQHAAMRTRQQAGRELQFVAGQRLPEVERAHEAFEARAQRQRDEGRAGQQLGERARGRGLGGAAWAFDEHAAQRGIDRGQQQRLAQLRLAGDRGKGKRHRHRGGCGHRGLPSICCSWSSSRFSNWFL
ncbi:hypothetical protein D9M68_730130 [compost metagenome]